MFVRTEVGNSAQHAATENAKNNAANKPDKL